MRLVCRLTFLAAATIVAACAPSELPDDPRSSGSRGVLPIDRASPLLYVALGDSTVEGVGASSATRNYVGQLHERLRHVYPRAQLRNLGVGGATAAEVLSRQLPPAITLRPDLVTLSVGPNDITRERDLESYARDIDAILRALAGRTDALVVVNLIPDLTVTPRFRGKQVEPLVRQRVIAFNGVLASQATAHGAQVVDLYAASRLEVPGNPALVGADGYHPSDEGYARWAELMWAGIEARLAPPRR